MLKLCSVTALYENSYIMLFKVFPFNIYQTASSSTHQKTHNKPNKTPKMMG